ncbi:MULTISPECIES: lecithin retinol acyltransferase family protein [Acinetobacter]|uniref:lecithin retinol acyltransferase family protein n=1 Tax=Acinetobacter TaxID=469 RepID=UPI0009D6F38D|nr:MULTISPECIES: lecithin retinol acyltransferase family protein [Acinetobacter]
MWDILKKVVIWTFENSIENTPRSTFPKKSDKIKERKLPRLSNIPFVSGVAHNIFLDYVTPEIGSVIHCGLAFNIVDHSGIYVGRNRIVHLDGSGRIEKVSPKQFVERLDGLNLAVSIYVSCKDGKPVGSKLAAKRAREKVGTRLNYSLSSNNCHIFTSGCLTGNFENKDNFFNLLTDTTEDELGSNGWRVWDIK